MITPLVIAIDGLAGSGKETLAAALARRFNLAHLDTGRIYRVTAATVLRAGGDPADAKVSVAAARGLDFALFSLAGFRAKEGDRLSDTAEGLVAAPLQFKAHRCRLQLDRRV